MLSQYLDRQSRHSARLHVYMHRKYVRQNPLLRRLRRVFWHSSDSWIQHSDSQRGRHPGHAVQRRPAWILCVGLQRRHSDQPLSRGSVFPLSGRAMRPLPSWVLCAVSRRVVVYRRVVWVLCPAAGVIRPDQMCRGPHVNERGEYLLPDTDSTALGSP
jgi:hypothetical protein